MNTFFDFDQRVTMSELFEPAVMNRVAGSARSFYAEKLNCELELHYRFGFSKLALFAQPHQESAHASG